MELLMEIVNVGVYSVLGIVLMILGNFLIDLIVPCQMCIRDSYGIKA